MWQKLCAILRILWYMNGEWKGRLRFLLFPQEYSAFPEFQFGLGLFLFEDNEKGVALWPFNTFLIPVIPYRIKHKGQGYRAFLK